MKSKPIIITLLLCFFAISAGSIYYISNEKDAIAVENLRIKQDKDDIWRVMDNEGKNRGTLKVKRETQVNWLANGSKMLFIFSDNVEKYFTYDKYTFQDGNSQVVEANKQLKVTLKKDAPKGELIYAVYAYKDSSWVVGNSAPIMIVY